MVHVTHSVVETPLNPFIKSNQSRWNNVNEVDNVNTPGNEHWCINRFKIVVRV